MWAVVALVLAAGWVGHEAQARHRVNWDGLAACASAYRVLYSGERPSLSEIGFAKPPLTALLMTPLGWIDADFLQSGAAAMLMGIASLMVAVMWAVSFLRRLGLAEWMAALLAIVFFTHPLVMSLYVGGSPSAHYFTLTLIGLGALAMWMAEMKLRDLIAASVGLGLAGLCDHLGLIVAAAATVAVAVRMATAGEGGEPSAPGRRKDGKRQRAAEGAALLFGIVPAYFYGLWVLAGWAIVGTPFESWQDWVQASAADLPSFYLAWHITLACGVWLGVAILGTAVRAEGLRPAARHILAVTLGTVLVVVVGGLSVGGRIVGHRYTWATAGPVALLVEAGVLVTAGLVFAEVRRGGWWSESRVWRTLGIAALVVMGLWSAGSGLRGAWPAGYADLFAGRIGVAGDYREAEHLAALTGWLKSARPAPPAVYMMVRPPAFAVGLATGDTKRVLRLEPFSEPPPGSYQVVQWYKELDVPKLWRSTPGYQFRTVRPVFVMWWGDYAVYRYEAAEGGR